MNEPRYFVTSNYVADHDSKDTVVAAFSGMGNLIKAKDYADWLNAGAPMPKFKVGDRVKFANSTSQTFVVEKVITEARYQIDSSAGGLWNERGLELAPPEPRATVKAGSSGGFMVDTANTSSWYGSKELADYIAAGLNEHPEWTL